MDPTSILVNSLTEALRQIHDYVAIGLTSAVAVFVLDNQRKRAAAPESAADQITVPVLGVPVGRFNVLLVVYSPFCDSCGHGGWESGIRRGCVVCAGPGAGRTDAVGA